MKLLKEELKCKTAKRSEMKSTIENIHQMNSSFAEADKRRKNLQVLYNSIQQKYHDLVQESLYET